MKQAGDHGITFPPPRQAPTPPGAGKISLRRHPKPVKFRKHPGGSHGEKADFRADPAADGSLEFAAHGYECPAIRAVSKTAHAPRPDLDPQLDRGRRQLPHEAFLKA